MSNISFNYLYRDYGNYKRYGSVIFSNPGNLPLAEIDTIIRNCIWDYRIFYAHQWKLSPLFFPEHHAELDHPFHEYESVELTDETPTDERIIDTFLSEIQACFKPLI